MNIEETYQQFESYLDSSMSVEERSAFELLLKTPEFNALFQEYAQVQKNYERITQQASQEEAFIKNLKTIAAKHNDSSNVSQDSKSSKLTFNKSIKWVMSAAAILLIGIVGYQQFFDPSQSAEELFAMHYAPEELSVERGSTNDSLATIVTKFNRKEYAEIRPLLEAFINNHPDALHLKIALAQCQMELGEYSKSETMFQEVIAQDNAFKQKAEWNMAMLYLKQGQKEKTITLLKQFKEDHFYYGKAQDILDELN